MIVSQLLHDKASIASCALVSRNWNCFVRHRLFETIQVKETADGFCAFMEFLEASPHILPRVRTLGLIGKHPRQTSSLCVHVLACILSRLPNLREASLTDVRIPSHCSCASPWCAEELLVNLEHLHLSRIWFTSPKVVVDFFALFSELDRLSLHHCGWMDVSFAGTWDALMKGLLSRLRLHSLQMDYFFLNTLEHFLCEFLSRTRSTGTLHTATVSFYDYDAVTAFGKLLSDVCPNIRHLRLHLPMENAPNDKETRILSSRLDIRYLLLTKPVHWDIDFDPLALVREILEDVSSTLRSLTLRLRCYTYCDVSSVLAGLEYNMHWGALSEILYQFTELKVLSLEFERDGFWPADLDNDSCRDLVEANIPNFLKQGVFRCSFAKGRLDL
ncbi:hypothetical protein SCP_0900140 [Sparassis crispa]|uniref:F-box domain-containing protein n=1 Tax=Sparassis crispa TaxID=139825 RepID=A0A401GV75_9APHY|nr:hypothetical protein SCP_0900140 [Sparassis crispa]GBE86137.1 hypothetical protein SCP_0900140 [Sparassis crispa]